MTTPVIPAFFVRVFETHNAASAEISWLRMRQARNYSSTALKRSSIYYAGLFVRRVLDQFG